jgi:hypothetical protein
MYALPGYYDPTPRHSLERLTLLHIFVIGLLLNVVAFGPLLTNLVFTNHTFPSVLEQGFPSYRSLEGRWGQDLLYLVLGKGATTSLGMFIALPVQVLNGMMFAHVLGRHDNLSRLIAIGLISTYPYVLDYYSFVGDNLTFVLANSCVLLAFLTARTWPRALCLSSLLIMASLSLYQPVISIITTVGLATAFCRVLDQDSPQASMWHELARCIVAVAAGAALYWVALYAVLHASPEVQQIGHFSKRLYTNSPAEAWAQMPRIVADFGHHLWRDPNFVFTSLGTLSAIAFGASLAWGIWLTIAPGRSGLQRLCVLLATLVWLVLAPVAAYAAYVVSKNSYWGSGRFLVPVVFVIAASLLTMTTIPRVRVLAAVAATLMVANFMLTDARIVQYAVMRSQWEMAFANRVVARMEPLLRQDLCGRTRLVMIGEPTMPITAIERPRTAYASIEATAFADYRHTEMFNYILGRNCLVRPTTQDVDQAIEAAMTRPPWPDPDSVFLAADDLLVIALRHYDGTPTPLTATAQ